MYFIRESIVDTILEEDIRFGDLSTALLDMKDVSAKASFIARQDCVVCGADEASRIIKKLGGAVSGFCEDGERAKKGQTVIGAKGSAGVLHAAWKTSVNLLGYCSGIATRTRTLLDAARRINPAVALTTTRKTIPGTRDLSVKAVYAGGAMPHRLGLAETVLFFREHYDLSGGFSRLLAAIPRLRAECPEKKLVVEVDNAEDAARAVDAGADGVQCDKVPPGQIKKIVKKAAAAAPRAFIIATGGITLDNIEAYARTGAQVIATSSVYFGPPVDFGFKIEKRR
ncbi:MAG TPA: ModD protein [Chitinivibrionales bacterium]|nr:ModD protein [Chitinivibrionales bacterium]